MHGSREQEKIYLIDFVKTPRFTQLFNKKVNSIVKSNFSSITLHCLYFQDSYQQSM